MQWVITREYMDFDDVRALSLPNIHGGACSIGASFSRCSRMGLLAIRLGRLQDLRTRGRTVFDDEARQREKYARPVEPLTM
jgi:hypothetical protein